MSKVVAGGSFRLKLGVLEFAELESTINFRNDDNTVDINYSRFADFVVDKVCAANYAKDVKFSLFIDEINLSMLQQKQHKKDSILIRDLILAIGKLNRVFVERNVPIYIYAAVRVEIAKGFNVSRNEIDKYLVDHGQKMYWHEGFEVERYPIFEIIEQRIAAIEREEFKDSNKPQEIWTEYFSRDIYGVSPKKFISEITWCNPRDIVNLFNLASNSHIARQKYDTSVFASIADQYSELVWSERAEELNAEHSMTVVNAVRKLLSGSARNFKVDHLEKRVEALKNSNPVISQVANTIGLEKLCRDLYHVGIIGQSVAHKKSHIGESGRASLDFHETWFYRDNREFDSSSWMIIHRALYPCLKLGAWKAEIFGTDPRIVSG